MLGHVGFIGVRDYGKSQTLKELVLLGIKSYKDFSQAKEF
ncbi:hypothetical protein HPSH417_01705 [Helicobacter pylori Shi417]|uniref:Uncharacterized protein n=1 Tax=Helicobacter pylori Shi169 TaxID=1163741 RepID=A0A0E0W9X7_HELPX|nr:hypothetical protein HPSH_01770 [Helicobacter pylori Shi470]AFH97494.1 hypothetical protein HPSH417_01705 [Helicobacter pylori Shi417]AFH99077.1 hypothetical protein HPSH169_01885 [Helicobacter pylori Shi169]